MNQYIIKFKFFTARAGRGNSISGDSGNGEIDISTEEIMDEKSKKDQGLINVCKQFLYNNPKVKKMGTIISLEILEINKVNP